MTGKEGEDIEGFASESCEVMRAAILVQQKNSLKKKGEKTVDHCFLRVYWGLDDIIYLEIAKDLHVRMYMILFINEFLNQKTFRLKLKDAKYMMIKTQQFT